MSGMLIVVLILLAAVGLFVFGVLFGRANPKLIEGYVGDAKDLAGKSLEELERLRDLAQEQIDKVKK